jgi:hypothetical protein
MLEKKETKEEAVERIVKKLSQSEAVAYKVWRDSNTPALAPSLNAQLFNLFLQGKGCDEIVRMNPGLRLGQVVAARVEGDWDRRREEHLDRLLTETSLRVQQTTLETADFVCDLLAVANKEHGEKLRRYLQTGSKSELGDFKIESLSGLKSAIEVLQKLTGQDKQQKMVVSGEVVHTTGPATPLSSDEADKALRLLLAKS